MLRPTPRSLVAPLAALAACAAAPATALAHQADPRYDSVLRGATPAVPGLRVAVLARGDELAIANATGRTVAIPGYRGEPYLRILADGTVQENLRSQATYANRDPKGTTPIPASADASGPDSPARWRTIDRSSRVTFHDHRIHWMGETGQPAPQVRDPSQRQRVFDWRVPLTVGTTSVRIDGTLFWTPEETGFPLAAGVGLGAVVVLAGALVVVVRRRRGPGTAGHGDAW